MSSTDGASGPAPALEEEGQARDWAALPLPALKVGGMRGRMAGA
jgi:hypothetical protein